MEINVAAVPFSTTLSHAALINALDWRLLSSDARRSNHGLQCGIKRLEAWFVAT